MCERESVCERERERERESAFANAVVVCLERLGKVEGGAWLFVGFWVLGYMATAQSWAVGTKVTVRENCA